MKTELKVLRVRNNLTQKDVAEKVGLSYPTYCLIEQGKRQGSINFWLAIQQLYQLEDSEVWQLCKNK